MAESENGTPDDVVFHDEGSFYDPDERRDDRREERVAEHGSDDAGEPEAAVGAPSPEGRQYDDRGGDERHSRRRRRRRRRSRRGGGGGDFQRGGMPQGQRQQRRGPGAQSGPYD